MAWAAKRLTSGGQMRNVLIALWIQHVLAPALSPTPLDSNGERFTTNDVYISDFNAKQTLAAFSQRR